VLFSLVSVQAINNGLGLLPPMGYNTWNDFECKVTAQNLMGAADAIVRQGLDKAGYVYVNLDDCWAVGRLPNGTVYADPKTFPKGMKPVSDYIHSKGLKFGIYTDRGTLTCQDRPGSQGFEIIDAQTYADWGVDYLKEDSCHASNDHNVAFKQYGQMRDGLNRTGRPIFFSLCGWADWYAPVGASLGNSWRISGDCTNWQSVLRAINTNAKLTLYARPGGWNDPDMLIGSSNTTAFHLLDYQSRTMFSLWSVMTAPLLIGSNIINLSPYDLATYSNSRVIAINQDALGLQGRRVAGGDLVAVFPQGSQSTYNVWAKPLAKKGQVATLFINTATSPQSVTCNTACMSLAGITSASYNVYDVWANKMIGTTSPQKGWTVQSLKENGGSQTLLFVPN